MQPLEDVRVLAVTVFLAGPYLSMNLARIGGRGYQGGTARQG